MSVSIKRALLRGHLRVSIPVFTILIGFIYTSRFLFESEYISAGTMFALFIPGIVLAWIWWSYFVVKWKLWAYANVENVDELKQRAVKGGLIWPEGSIFNKTEIWTEKDRSRLKEIRKDKDL